MSDRGALVSKPKRTPPYNEISKGSLREAPSALRMGKDQLKVEHPAKKETKKLTKKGKWK